MNEEQNLFYHQVFQLIALQDYLNKIKDYLNDDGCLCLAVKNKEGITIVKEESSKNNFLDNFKGYNSIKFSGIKNRTILGAAISYASTLFSKIK